MTVLDKIVVYGIPLALVVIPVFICLITIYGWKNKHSRNEIIIKGSVAFICVLISLFLLHVYISLIAAAGRLDGPAFWLIFSISGVIIEIFLVVLMTIVIFFINKKMEGDTSKH